MSAQASPISPSAIAAPQTSNLARTKLPQKKINTIYSSLDLRDEFGGSINRTLEDYYTADEDLAAFVCEAYKRNNIYEMFSAIVGRDIDDIIDRMNTLPVEAEREAAE